jgi:hypothetical protein
VEVAHLPIPDLVIGMLVLTASLATRSGRVGSPVPSALDRTAGTLTNVLGLRCSTNLSVLNRLHVPWTRKWRRYGNFQLYLGLRFNIRTNWSGYTWV